MEIELTKKQYKNLVELVYLGNWMVNAIRSGRPGDERIEKYEEVQQHIFSFAEGTDFDIYIDFDEELEKFYLVREFVEDGEIEQYKEEYDSKIFWRDLIDELAWRDLFKEYDQKTIEEMSAKERFVRKQELAEKYAKEFEENGIENLILEDEK